MSFSLTSLRQAQASSNKAHLHPFIRRTYCGHMYRIWYDKVMANHQAEKNQLIPMNEQFGDGRNLQTREEASQQPSPLQIAGKIANRAAGRNIFRRYLDEKASNTIKRQARDLELFAEYLMDAGIPLEHGADFQTNPAAWRGVTWGIVEGFVQWQLREGYAISSVNARLSTIRTYSQMATKAGAIERTEGVLIQSVKGFSRQGGLNVNERRRERDVPTRIEEVTYAYKPEDAKKTVVVTRRNTKKRRPNIIGNKTAEALKRPANESPQAWRDALLMCLLLDHGLRASEAAILKVSDIDLSNASMTFFRPKIKGTDNEWTTHKLTPPTQRAASYYINQLYPPTLQSDGRLILATSRLLKDGSGGELLEKGLNRVRISERVAYLGKSLGVSKKLSAHDCRHTCATKMARLGYGVDELMAWFGWTSAQTAVRYIASAEVKERYRG